MTKWVYTFGGGQAEGGAADLALLGGKGANLAEMTPLGLPVPPGFTITTEACGCFSTMAAISQMACRTKLPCALAASGSLPGAHLATL